MTNHFVKKNNATAKPTALPRRIHTNTTKPVTKDIKQAKPTKLPIKPTTNTTRNVLAADDDEYFVDMDDEFFVDIDDEFFADEVDDEFYADEVDDEFYADEVDDEFYADEADDEFFAAKTNSTRPATNSTRPIKPVLHKPLNMPNPFAKRHNATAKPTALPRRIHTNTTKPVTKDIKQAKPTKLPIKPTTNTTRNVLAADDDEYFVDMDDEYWVDIDDEFFADEVDDEFYADKVDDEFYADEVDDEFYADEVDDEFFTAKTNSTRPTRPFIANMPNPFAKPHNATTIHRPTPQRPSPTTNSTNSHYPLRNPNAHALGLMNMTRLSEWRKNHPLKPTHLQNDDEFFVDEVDDEFYADEGDDEFFTAKTNSTRPVHHHSNNTISHLAHLIKDGKKNATKPIAHAIKETAKNATKPAAPQKGFLSMF
jgi:hypothetical protein